MNYLLPASLIASLFISPPAWAQGEHGRRVAAELLVLNGDARDLVSRPPASKLHVKGLKDRLRGGLAGLAILMRLADQEVGRPPVKAQEIAAILRKLLASGNMTRFQQELAPLIRRYPLVINGMTSTNPAPAQLASARKIHEDICAACHDEPDRDVERPAYNLRTQARRMSWQEFTARLIAGVRGDRLTGFGNPLSDDDLTNLVAFYRSTQ